MLSWLLDKSTKDSVVQGEPQPNVKYSQVLAPAGRHLNLGLKQKVVDRYS